MADGWKQVLDDLRNALRGAKPEGGAPPAPPPDERAVTQSDIAIVEGAVEHTAPPVLAPGAEQGDSADGVSVAPATHEAGQPGEGVLAETADQEVRQGNVLEAAAEPQQPPPPRPLPRWFYHAGNAVVVLLIAFVVGRYAWQSGLNETWTRWTEPTPPAPNVVASFTGGQITTADLEAHFQALVPGAMRTEVRSLETLRDVVQEMVTDEFARRWAAEQQADSSETFRHAMEHATESINLDSLSSQLHEGGIPVAESEIQSYYEANKAQFGDQPLSAVRDEIRRVLVEQNEDQYLNDYIERLKAAASITRDFTLLQLPEPTEAELRSFFEANTESYTVTARVRVDLLTVSISGDEAAARAAADKALLAVRSGAEFSAVPDQVPEARVLTDTLVLSGELGPEWDAAVNGLQPGEVSEVLRAGEAFDIVRLIEAQPARQRTFEEARPQLLETVLQQQLDAWMQANSTKTLFTIKGRQYTLGQFYTEYQELPAELRLQFPGSEGMQQLAEALIERLLVVEDTYDQLLQVENKELIDQTRLDLLKQMLDQEEVDDKIEITDEQVQQYYDQNLALMAPPPEARMRYIRIVLGQTDDERAAAVSRADEAYRKLVPGPFQQGADFAAVAQEYSEDTETATNGGELPGWIGETESPFEPPELHTLHAAVMSLEVNAVSAPFELGDSLYIVQVIERRQPPAMTLEQLTPSIKEFLRQQRHDELLVELQNRLAQEMGLVVYDRVLRAYVDETATAAAPAFRPTVFTSAP
jgi:peptidyl-prolyl cis-trans isomerase D